MIAFLTSIGLSGGNRSHIFKIRPPLDYCRAAAFGREQPLANFQYLLEAAQALFQSGLFHSTDAAHTIPIPIDTLPAHGTAYTAHGQFQTE
jgi:hypothetical protein